MQTPAATTVWQTSKLLMKALIISALVLLLLIPANFVKELVFERQATQQQASREVTSRWAGRQTITGPVMVIPYIETQTIRNQSVQVRKTAYLLPDTLSIGSDVKPEKKYRGIYQVMLYSASVEMQGKFSSVPLDKLELPADAILWNEISVSVGVTDPKGMDEELALQWNQQPVPMALSTADPSITGDGFTAPVHVVPGEPVNFSATFRVKGSEQLMFTPVGRETTVKLASGWPDPSFTGNELPVHQISDSGFKATWKSPAHHRTYPQAWKQSIQNLKSSSFGIDLYIQVNNYQKILRSVKYAFLCIILTFAAFFIVEINSARSIHPIQYGLIGLALILFYTLLLSISEYTGFDLAYLIASVATIALIAWFVRGLLLSNRLSAVIAIVMLLLYSYIFCILQLQDYSLLLGSIGLFLTLGVIMRFSKKLQW